MDVMIGLVLDRSGSMNLIWDDTLGGVKRFVEEQREVDGRAFLTLMAFDGQFDLVHESAELSEIDTVIPSTVYPRGSTALIDAVIRTIKSIEAQQRNNKFAPKNVVMVIVTDGYENASRHSAEELRLLIDAKREAGWEFVYLGANQDAWTVGSGYGFNHNSTWTPTSAGTEFMYDNLNVAVASYRSTGNTESLNVET